MRSKYVVKTLFEDKTVSLSHHLTEIRDVRLPNLETARALCFSSYAEVNLRRSIRICANKSCDSIFGAQSLDPSYCAQSLGLENLHTAWKYLEKSLVSSVS